jgi:hypothetical protein
MPSAPPTDLPPHARPIEVHVGDLNQLYHSLDPTPFRERDLDPKAVEFIVSWARDLGDRDYALVVHVDQPPESDQVTVFQGSVKEFFHERAEETRRRLRQLFRVGHTALIIGLMVLAASIIAGDLIADMLRTTRFSGVAQESLLIGGWVAMWRPLELFLYDWWPIRAEARMFDRLSAMAVRVIPSRSA